MVVTVSGRKTVVSELHPLHRLMGTLTSADGNASVVNAEHPKKTLLPSVVSGLQNVTVGNDVQLRKQLLPMSSTEGPIVMDVSEVHPKQVLSGSEVAPKNDNVVMAEQLRKHPVPKVVTVEGIVMYCKAAQF